MVWDLELGVNLCLCVYLATPLTNSCCFLGNIFWKRHCLLSRSEKKGLAQGHPVGLVPKTGLQTEFLAHVFNQTDTKVVVMCELGCSIVQ